MEPELRGYIIDRFSIPAALLIAWQLGGARPRSAASFLATEQVFINTVRVAENCRSTWNGVTTHFTYTSYKICSLRRIGSESQELQESQ